MPWIWAAMPQRMSPEPVAVVGHETARDHRTPGVPEDDVGQVGVELTHLVAQSALISHHDLVGVVSGVGPDPRGHGRLAVSGVVVGDDDEPGIEQLGDQSKVAARVLTESVDDVDDAARLGGGLVDPTEDGVATVGRRELDFVK